MGVKDLAKAKYIDLNGTTINLCSATIPYTDSTGISDGSSTNDSNFASGSFTLEPGLWIVTVTGRWVANATGFRQVWISNSSTGAARNLASFASIPAVSGAITSIQITVPLKPTSQTTYYIVTKQTSGSALTVNTRYTATRLGDV